MDKLSQFFASTYSSTKPTETQLRELRAIPGVRNVTVGCGFRRSRPGIMG